MRKRALLSVAARRAARHWLLGSCVLVCAHAALAIPIISHQGMADPATEGWTVNASSPDTTGGGSEVTASGSHDYWQIDHPTGNQPVASAVYSPTAQELASDWGLDASLRIIDSPPHCCFTTPLPFTGLSVRDGTTTWGLVLGNDIVGILDNTAAPSTMYARSALVDTRADYHDYQIRIRRNGPGAADDTADYYYDGAILFAGVTRAELEAFAGTSVSWGPGARDQTSIANYETVMFFTPEPSTALLLAASLAGLAAAGRRRSRY